MLKCIQKMELVFRGDGAFSEVKAAKKKPTWAQEAHAQGHASFLRQWQGTQGKDLPGPCSSPS
jgi:hypothetical protein